MATNASKLSWTLVDAARGIGIERGVDLVLSVLLVRWATLHGSDADKGWHQWAGLVDAGTDEELASGFSDLANFGEEEPLPFAESREFVDVLRKVVHAVDENIEASDVARSVVLVANTFDAVIEHLGRLGKQAGEADTPRALAELMAALTVRPGDRVFDPVCGNGTGLIVAAQRAPNVSVSGLDINLRVSRRAAMRLLVHGIETGESVGVLHGDAFEDYESGGADVILAQPPWNATFSENQKARIKTLAQRYASPLSTPGFPKADMPWLLLSLDALELDAGRAAVVMAGSSTAPRCRETHEGLLALGAVEALIALPPGLFAHSGISTTLWLLRAPGEATTSAPKSVLMVDMQTLVESSGLGRVMFAADAQTFVSSIVEAHRNARPVDAPLHVARAVRLDEIDLGRGLNPQSYLGAPPEATVAHPVPERCLLTRVALSNFKAFGPATSVPLAPLTLVYGANSAGKSSIIQALLLLKQSRNENRLVTQGPIVNVGSFRGILHRHAESHLGISLSYGVLPDWIPAGGTPDPALPRSATWVFATDSAGHGTAVKAVWTFGQYELSFSRSPDSDDFSTDLDGLAAVFEGVATGTLLYPFDERQGHAGDVEGERRRFLSRRANARSALRALERTGVETLQVEARGLMPSAHATMPISKSRSSERVPGIMASYVNRTARLAGGISDEVDQLLESLAWLGPLRSAPQRVYDRAEATGAPGDGRDVAIYLFDHASVVEQVNDWFKRLEVPYTLEVLPVTAGNAANLVGDLVAISLTDTRSGVVVTPADVGFGISQVLPIVVELLSRRDSVIAIEQPETHLHPRLQARLADLFIDTVQEGGRGNQLIIETHSEHLMLRIQRRIREGALDPRSVSVVYVDQAPTGRAIVKPLRLNDRGEFLDEWPDGFFDDRLDELFGGF